MSLNIHADIKDKLYFFNENKKIPNIIFHGSYGCGKNKLVSDFIDLIYQDKNKKDYVMYVNCAHGKGIKFIREELKFFAKTNMNFNKGEVFKSVILLNADKLTMDAQSALRRCIELFSHTTRFFIIVEDKYKLLKPILSRFCEIYVPEPSINGVTINLHKYNLEKIFNLKDIKSQRLKWLKDEFEKNNFETKNESGILDFVTKLYEKGYSGLDILGLIENNCFNLSETKKYELLLLFNKIKKEFRNEKMLILYFINFIFLNKTEDISENIFM